MPKRKTIDRPHVNVLEILKLIPDCLLQELTTEYQSDKWVSKLKSGSIFKLVLYSMLRSERLSLRQMAENYSTPWFRLLDKHAISETAHNSIRDRLLNMNIGFVKAIYEHVYEQLQQQYTTSTLKRFHIKRYDSTMVQVFAHLLDGMRVGQTSANKRLVKLTTEFKDDLLIHMRFHSEQHQLQESISLKEAIEKAEHASNDILVFDRGFRKRSAFIDFSESNVFFVTRLTDNTRFKTIASGQLPAKHPQLDFIQDSIVHLYGSSNKIHEYPFRLIEVRRKSDGQTILFLTNLFELSAEQIAAIYQQRWDIEVLFKFLKQEMNLKHFVSHDSNAIAIMIYTTLIAAMLILLFRKLNEIKSYRMAKIRFFNELQAAVILDFLDSTDNIQTLRNNVNQYLKLIE